MENSNRDEKARTAQEYLEAGLAYAKSQDYENAWKVFSQGLSLYPFDVQLRQQRARKHMVFHPWQAISDFVLASRLEPSNWEIWYYMGVAYFFLREYGQAQDAFQACLKAAQKTGDDIVPVLDWLWTIERQLGGDGEGILELFSLEMPIEEDNYAYYRRLMLYKGLLDEKDFYDEAVLVSREMGEIDWVTQAWGLANYLRLKGEGERAVEVLKSIRARSKFTAAFAHVLTERDLGDLGL
jgi:tetratricopeptide (TPR) repeat protein